MLRVSPTITKSRISCITNTFITRKLKNEAYINGKWVKSMTGQQFKVFNPANGSCIAEVPNMNSRDVEIAAREATNAFKSWSQLTAKERSKYIRQFYYAVSKRSEDLANIVHMEAGKPYSEAIGEVNYGSSFLEWFSEQARSVQGEVLASPSKSKELMHLKLPVGVAGLITPWNFPLAMITRKVGAALAAGCTCVIKPAEDTPLTALALAECAEDAGIPPGVINVITSDRNNAAEIGTFFCESPDINVITFTGSTTVGKLLYKQCASRVKRLALELGGNAPFIVFKTADIKKAVEGAAASKFRNAGQTCVSANRFFIESSIFDEFVHEFTKYIAERLVFGESEGKNPLGPLINKSQLKKVEGIVNDAISQGARVHCGGKRASQVGDLFYEPTLLTNIKPEMRCYHEEIFGPVVSCIKFSDENEVLRIANNVNSGLAGYFYSSDLSQIFRVGRKLEVGMVGINDGIISTPEAAFGGIKESGLGREGSHYGLDEFLYVKYLCFGNL